jgi:two-component system, LytTR family, sensor histidine kinase AlgZ
MDTGNQISERSPISKVYWACQLAGWSTLLLFQLFALAVLRVDRSVPGELVSSHASLYVAIALLSVSGLLVSHLLYLLMRRRRWLQMPLGRIWPRLLAAVALAAVVPSAIDIFLSVYLFHPTPEANLRPAARLISWLVFVFLFAVWVTIYLAVQEFRRRRIAEIHALRLELVAQEAQLRGLRAQLKPHFLFNCLNGLRELIVEDPQRAQSMVTRLSALLRYSLQSDHKEQVFLEEEIQAVKDYLELEAIRFEERLSVQWDIAPESSKVPVPPMLLQTLVENALKHGISRRPEGGEISIKALVRDSQLLLEVLNTGELSEQPSENGIGLRNARSRLQLLYGDQAKIVLENAPHGHARAVGTVPLQGKGGSQ